MTISELRAAVLLAWTLLVVTACCAQAADNTGWCPWLPWTCETKRTPVPWWHSAPRETVECQLRRQRFCCNSEPPLAKNVCPGPFTGRRDGGPEQLAKSGRYRGMRCPVNDAFLSGSFAVHLKVEACTTAYPIPDPGRSTVWCPWAYWSSWYIDPASTSLAGSSSCLLKRSRQRRCGCSSTRRISSWVPEPVCSTQPASASVDNQQKNVNCTSGTGGDCSYASNCRQGHHTIVDEERHKSPIPIVIGCLAVLVAVVAVVTILVICCSMCKKKRATTAAAVSQRSRPNFAARIASSFRRGVGMVGVAVPSAPAYGSAAFYDGCSGPVPTVSLKVAGSSTNVNSSGEGSSSQQQQQQVPPPPYTSQPEMPRGGFNDGLVSGGRARPPPPYSWDSPPVEP